MSNIQKYSKEFTKSSLKYQIKTGDIVSDKQESVRLLKLVNKDDPETVWRFVIANIKLIDFLVFKTFHKVTDEMISDGVKALYKATLYYNPKYAHGAFMSYAGKCIINAVHIGNSFTMTQLTAKKKNYISNQTIALSFNNQFNDIYNLSEIISDPVSTSPLDETMKSDETKICKKIINIIRKSKYTKKQVTVLREYFALIHTDNEVYKYTSIIANKLKCSKQAVNHSLHGILDNLNQTLLKKDNDLRIEFLKIMGKKTYSNYNLVKGK